MSFKRKLIHLHFLLAEQLGLDPLKFMRAVRGLPAYVRDLYAFKKGYHGPLALTPCFGDRYQQGGSVKSEYFWQDLLVARKVFQARPNKHVDVGSRIDGFVAHVASFRDIEVFDIRPVHAAIPGVIFKQADVMAENFAPHDLTLGTGYCDSISCLHAIEHFGLGRYGDPIHPAGYLRGIANLSKLLLPSGRLYLSTPIGRERVEFNANWVFHPQTIANAAADVGLRLDELIVLDQQGGHNVLAQPSAEILHALSKEHYRLGIFSFTKVSNA